MKRIGYIDGRRIAGFTKRGLLATDGMKIDIEDLSTISTGYEKGIYINYKQKGLKTGGDVNPLTIDVSVEESAAGGVFPISLYLAMTSGKNVGNLGFLATYMEDIGAGVIGNVMLADLARVITNLGASRDAFIRFRNHGAVAGKSGIYLEGYPNIVTNLITFSHPVPPFIGAAVGGAQTAKIQVNTINPVASWFIPLHTA